MKNNQKGFGAIEGLLIVIIIGLIGFIGWYVYHTKNVTDKTLNTASSTSAATAATEANPYTGWKTYCNVSTKECFQYPSDWTLTSGVSINTQVENPSKSVQVVYSNPSSDFGGPQTFHTTSIDSLAKSNSALKVVGGYYTATNTPIYYLIDSTLIQQYSLTSGSTTDNVGYLDYTSGSSSASLAAYDNTNTQFTATQADSWFSSTDAKTALLIAKSFYKQ